MPGFGENLRREREMRAVTLDEISESTKISTRFLQALEQERFAELPGGIFTRSFIRAYAQYLGLDEEHVLAEYKRAAQPGSDNDLARLGASRPLPEHSSSRARAVPWVVAAALLAGGYAAYRYSHRPAPIPAFPAPRSVPAENSTPTAGTGAAQPSAPAGSGAPVAPAGAAAGSGNTEAGASNSGAEARAPGASTPAESGGPGSAAAPGAAAGSTSASTPSLPSLGEGDLVLQVATTEQAWLAVAADGKTLMQGILQPNTVRVFRAHDSFDVTTGNAQGTVLTLNGETRKPLGRSGEFKKIHLARSDFGPQAP